MIKYSKFNNTVLIITWLICCLALYGQIDENYYQNQKKALSASSEAECRSSLKFCREALKVVPDHPVLNYLMARLNERLGNNETAFKYLKKAAKLGYTSNIRWLKIHPGNDPLLTSLRKKREFKKIMDIMKISDKPVHKSQVAFVVKDKKIGTEGIAYDPVEKMFYLGSDFKIVKVDPFGNSVSFTHKSKEDGLGWVNGIHIDPVSRVLWACSNGESRLRTGIFKYDLSTGKLIKKYQLSSDEGHHMFNDLVIHPGGDIFVTNTGGGGIYKISQNSNSFELFLKSKLLTGPNGITVSENGKAIFTTSNIGIFKIDIKTKSVTLLTQEPGFHTFGIDGLYFKNNQLYAVQNELLTQVSRFSLNKDANHIKSCEIFEKNTDDLRAPTTGVLVDDFFYFIADTQGKGSKKKGIVVMKVLIK